MTGRSDDFAARMNGVEPCVAGRVDALHQNRLQPRVRIRAVFEQQADDLEACRAVVGVRRVAPEHPRQRAHVDGRVQRRHAGGVGDIRIRAGLNQELRGVVVRVDDCKHQRRRAVRIRKIEARTRVDEHARRVDCSLTRGKHQRRPLAARQDDEPGLTAWKVREVRAPVEVGAVRDQELHDVRVIPCRRPDQRGLAE